MYSVPIKEILKISGNSPVTRNNDQIGWIGNNETCRCMRGNWYANQISRIQTTCLVKLRSKPKKQLRKWFQLEVTHQLYMITTQRTPECFPLKPMYHCKNLFNENSRQVVYN